jgi:hypothetical protein
MPPQANPTNQAVFQTPQVPIVGGPSAVPPLPPSSTPASKPSGANVGKKSNPNSTQNSMLFSEIRDGLIIMNDGSYRAVVMARSINFDQKSAAEQDGVEYSYQGFLNSLYFDAQILIQSRKIDMGPYLQRLENVRSQQDNMLLSMLMADYIDFIDDLVAGTNIMDKKFFIVVPYFKEADSKAVTQAGSKFLSGIFGGSKSQAKLVIDENTLNAAKTELKNRVQLVVNGLINMGIQAAALDTKELIELFYNSYNPDTARHEPLGSNTDFNAPIVTKGEGRAKQTHLEEAI